MGRSKKSSHKDKCKAYLDRGTRRKNATRRQERFLTRLAKKHPEAAEKMRKHNVIGRRKEKAGKWS